MTPNQEEALYKFLETASEPFTLEEVTAFVQTMDPSRAKKLRQEIATYIDLRKTAFRLDNRQWLSRRGFFEKTPFVISPTRLELINGILIPGHRCVPFANPAVLPHEYTFFWQGKQIPETTSEGPPEDFYPFYAIFGDEFAPQYIAQDNPENESAFNCDPYEDPPEVSIHTLDMRNIFREAAFVPGDRFVARTRDWREGRFDLEKVNKDTWAQADLSAWFEAAEEGFEKSFTRLGPGVSTEEQIAFAYWYGGKRMREIPAYSLEEFLNDKTDHIEMVPYGIETRYWFAGKDIPDSKKLLGFAVPPDHTLVEEILFNADVPVSEYVILAYIRDALFRKEINIDKIINNIVPASIRLDNTERNILAKYIFEAMKELKEEYSPFFDQLTGPVRQRACELHNAVVDLAAGLHKGEMDLSWLPRHIFISLSQIQGYTANLLENVDSLLEEFDLLREEALDSNSIPLSSEMEEREAKLDAMEFSIDTLIDAFNDQKEMINSAMNNFRLSNFTLVNNNAANENANENWQTAQISISGTDVWRRVIIPRSRTLADLHNVIQVCMNWQDTFRHRFFAGGFGDIDRKELDDKIKIRDICELGSVELEYEYGNKWTIKVMLFSPHQAEKDESIRCVAGNGAAPPENIGGPLKFRKMLEAVTGGGDTEQRETLRVIQRETQQETLRELGPDFTPELFDMEKCNRNLQIIFGQKNEN